MSETVKTIMISNKDLAHLFKKILTPENIKLVRGQVSTDTLSHNIVKRVSRCFNEKEFPPGKLIVEEGMPLKSIYVIKSGTCEVFSERNPLKSKQVVEEEYF